MEKKQPNILNSVLSTFLYQKKTATKEVVDSISDYFRQCPKCGNQGTVLGLYQEECLIMKCPTDECDTPGWGACIRCETSRKHIETLAQWKRHKRNNHNKQKGSMMQAKDSSLTNTAAANSNQTASIEPEFPVLEDPTTNQTYKTDNDEDATSLPCTSQYAHIFGQHADVLRKYKLIDCDPNGNSLGFVENSRSARFFQQDFLAGPLQNGGIDYLVKRAVLIRGNVDAAQYRRLDLQLPPGQTEFHIKIAELVFGIGPRQKELVVEVLQGAYKIGLDATQTYKDLAGERTRFLSPATYDQSAKGLTSTRIPDNVNDIRRCYAEGANSIIQNLPYPEIQKDVPGHSYLSIQECIRDFLAQKHGHRMATISDEIGQGLPKSISHTSHSQRAQQILKHLSSINFDDSVIKSYLFFWSDDVEPNRLSKAGRGSVWVATMTIGTQPNDAHNLANTYPIAIGKKGTRHDEVLGKFENEMQGLRAGKGEPFYVGALRQRAQILFSDMAQLSDQPERRGLNFLRLGGRGFTARFGVSANHNECYRYIRACQGCQKINQQRLYDGNHILKLVECEECMNWDVLAESTLGLATPPENYPLLQCKSLPSTEGQKFYHASPFCRLVWVADDEQKIKPFRISYASLKGSVELAHLCYCHHGWSSHNVSAYLKVEGLNDEFIALVLEHATNAYSLMTAQAAQAESENQDIASYYATIVKDAERYPAKYQQVPYPAAWNRDGFELHHHPDVIMHLMFLGIVDDTMQLTQNWLKATKRNAAFIKANAPHLDPLTKMDIQWINVLKYTGEGFGHWVSENYLGFARVMPWFYQNIDEVAPEPIILPPEATQKGWTKKHNEHWLKCRGLDTAGTAVELRKRVEKYMAQATPPPLIQEPIRAVEDIEELMIALYTLLECVMSTSVTDSTISRTKYAIRVFLSAYDRVNTSVKGESTSIFSIFNLACLMNLPEAMQQFGPLRQLWEGSTKGEGILRFVKPLMTQGFKHQSNWHYHLLQKLCVAKAFSNIIPKKNTPVLGSVDSHTGVLAARKGYFKKHKSLYEFRRDMEATHLSSKKPISVILVKGQHGNVRIMAVVDTYEKVISIEQSASIEPTTKFGLKYYRFDANDYELVPWSQVSKEVDEIGYGLLLPMLSSSMQTAQKFALIGSNWKTLGPSVALADLIDRASVTFD